MSFPFVGSWRKASLRGRFPCNDRRRQCYSVRLPIPCTLLRSSIIPPNYMYTPPSFIYVIYHSLPCCRQKFSNSFLSQKPNETKGHLGTLSLIVSYTLICHWLKAGSLGRLWDHIGDKNMKNAGRSERLLAFPPRSLVFVQQNTPPGGG